LIFEVVRSRAVTPERWREICRLLHESGSIDYAMHQAREQASTAKKQLYLFPPSAAREALMALPDYILARDR
jgi:geranylgeranyl pyrophosphate synthase